MAPGHGCRRHCGSVTSGGPCIAGAMCKLCYQFFGIGYNDPRDALQQEAIAIVQELVIDYENAAGFADTARNGSRFDLLKDLIEKVLLTLRCWPTRNVRLVAGREILIARPDEGPSVAKVTSALPHWQQTALRSGQPAGRSDAPHMAASAASIERQVFAPARDRQVIHATGCAA